jgi:hypothetical protein
MSLFLCEKQIKAPSQTPFVPKTAFFLDFLDVEFLDNK